ncbi:hypothetical protein FACS18949_12970 [Clostridia bacterium]|nr:hypothetical protein FACS189425_04340 [Clostridia bacterium]GHV35297.1 hypothetical protein FACS18949_12970 [Clostridia bacterium]
MFAPAFVCTHAIGSYAAWTELFHEELLTRRFAGDEKRAFSNSAALETRFA